LSYIKLIVGLGNPGKEYAETRHNVGFKVVDVLCENESASSKRTEWQEKADYHIREMQIAGERVRILKPQSYMNNSGMAVADLAGFYKIEPSALLVIHDELDLPFGVMRLKEGGGDAGNNGLRSITSCLGSPDYLRLRVGIGRPGLTEGTHPEMDVSAWVLSKFNAEEKKTLPELLIQASEAVLDLAEHGLKHAQNKFNR
jgi:PTH1 family peptidyl-tRNA hydrolase